MATRTTDNFDFISYRQEQVRIDGDAVKELLGRLKEQGKISDADYMGCFKEITFTVNKTTRRDPSQKPKFVAPVLDNVTLDGVIEMLALVRERNAIGKKEEGYLKERLQAELVAAGLTEPSEAPPMPEWLKMKIAAGDMDD